MAEPISHLETSALRDVLAERQKQIDKGYTPDHDDEHPPSRIMSYGGLTWHPPLYGPTNAAKSRAAMVRMAACLLAAIERVDRGDYLTTPTPAADESGAGA